MAPDKQGELSKLMSELYEIAVQLKGLSILPEDIDENNIKCPFLELNEHATEYTRENRKSKDAIVAWQLSKAATYNGKMLFKPKQEITVNSDIKLVDKFNFNSN